MPNPDKPDRKKKKSDWKETPSKSHSWGGHPGECTHYRAAHRLGEELVQRYQADEEEKERQPQPKKPKKGSSSWKETLVTRDSSKEDERERRKRRKEKKAQAREAELRTDRERR